MIKSSRRQILENGNWRSILCVLLVASTGASVGERVAHAQSNDSIGPIGKPTQLTSHSPTGDQVSPMDQRISLDLRDATLLEALFAVRDASGLNLVVGNEVTGTVNAAFSESTVSQILDSLLLPRGYGYRMVSGSLVIVPLEHLGDNLPWFETAVMQLQNSTPNELISTVESLLSPEGRVHAVPSSNALVIMDHPEQIANVRNQVSVLENAALQHASDAGLPPRPGATTSVESGSVESADTIVRVYEPQFVPAAILSDGVTPLLSEVGRISPLELEDKLVISDRREAIERVTAAIEQLDRPRPQVRIRALIYDCGLEDVERVGVNWRSGFNGRSIDATTGNPSQSVVLNTLTANVPTTAANGALTLTSLNRYSNIETVLQALETSDDSRLLADPNVVVMNHETAEIEIVTEIPYQQLTQGLEGGTIGTTEFREAGVTLNVIPHIAQDGTIAMVVNPRFSLLTGFSEPDNAPIIDRRETRTTVRVYDQQTLVLGGLRQRTRTVERSVIPGLGRIPKIGHLFRHKSLNARESELLVFITPEIVMPDYPGTPREACVGAVATREINQTPTDPRPFGMPILRAEDCAFREALDRRCPSCKCRSNTGQHLSTCELQGGQCGTYGMIEMNSEVLSVAPDVSFEIDISSEIMAQSEAELPSPPPAPVVETNHDSGFVPVRVTPADAIPVRISAAR